MTDTPTRLRASAKLWPGSELARLMDDAADEIERKTPVPLDEQARARIADELDRAGQFASIIAVQCKDVRALLADLAAKEAALREAATKLRDAKSLVWSQREKAESRIDAALAILVERTPDD